MDGWSVPRNGSVLDCGETGGSCETDGICVDIGNNNSLNGTDKLQVLFDQVLLIFMKEVLGNECVRPIPAMLGDGRSVDLFKLFWVVRGKGGYEWVSDKGLWGLVAEECGLDVGVKTCLKLIYFKYLDQLDQWLLGILRDGRLILGGTGPKEKDDGVFELESERTDNCVDLDKEKSILNLKRESFSGMLNWVREIAKHPEEPYKGNKNGNEVFSTQILRVRESLLIRRKVHTKEEQSLLQKQKMHPSMYEDNIVVNHQSTEKSRCSRRLFSVKSHLCSCSAAQSKLPGPHRTKSESCPKEQALTPNEQEPENTNTLDDLFPDDLFLKPIPVGPNFQAEVPEWTGEVTESDSKWLGTQVWPLENGECSFRIEKDCVGRGKPDSCDCRFSGSVECVRFHIAEKRMKLKLDLGSLFYHWRFDRMGEEISLAWTTEEEKRFKHMIRLNSSLQSPSFWDNALRIFPTKTREALVSYYFNVFLIRRRIYQNRVTPRKIDSDDDELEFGSLGGSFGHEVIKVPWSEFLTCTQNEQSTELD
ncbi:unnamed protein product, partial [Vitis vinifera]